MPALWWAEPGPGAPELVLARWWVRLVQGLVPAPWWVEQGPKVSGCNSLGFLELELPSWRWTQILAAT